MSCIRANLTVEKEKIVFIRRENLVTPLAAFIPFSGIPLNKLKRYIILNFGRFEFDLEKRKKIHVISN